ncbi:hypothetical protein lerEdw1_019842 [Lerista edwardsae]|nr:hypothetical protein lerEdw1_019842 [Lerista edwardsae]
MANAKPWKSVKDQDMEMLFDEFFKEFSISSAAKPTEFGPRTREPVLYSLRDHDQKGVYLHKENLVAAPLQGSNTAHEEVLSVLPNKHLERDKFPLILGVRGGKQGLSCGKAGEPKLQLESHEAKSEPLYSCHCLPSPRMPHSQLLLHPCMLSQVAQGFPRASPFALSQDVNLPDLFNDAEEAKRFTFFKDFNGSTHTFESAAFPKWFLCSAVEAHKPLAVTDRPGGTDITTFFFQRKELRGAGI